jgi:hypothetical protein
MIAKVSFAYPFPKHFEMSSPFGFRVLPRITFWHYGAVTYYFPGDDRLVYLPWTALKETSETLGAFVLKYGDCIRFHLEAQTLALKYYLKGDSIAFYNAMGGATRTIRLTTPEKCHGHLMIRVSRLHRPTFRSKKGT